MKKEHCPTDNFVVRRPCLNYNGIPLERKQIEELIRQDFFQEAIYYASPDLYSELMKYLDGKLPEKKTQRMIATIYKYAERIHYRCTPFGMFAFCSVGHYAEETEIPENSGLKLHYRYDCQFLYDYTLYLIRTAGPELLETLSVCANQTCLTVSDHIRMHARNEAGAVTEIRVKRSDLLAFILKTARAGIGCKHLVESCLNEYDINKNDLLEYIRSLILKGILVSDLQVETTGEDNLSRIIDKWGKMDIPLLGELANTMEVLQNAVDFSKKKQALESLYDKSCQLGINVKRNQMIQVDTYGVSEIEIDRRVKVFLEEWFDLLQSICAPTGNPLANFANRFSTRYENMSVPLLEVLDKQIGIGYNAGFPSKSTLIESIYRIPGNHQGSTAVKSYNLTIMEQAVLDRMKEADSFNIKRIRLDDVDFKKYGTITHSDYCLSFSCMFSIVGCNENGPILNGIHFSGPSASCLLTRFADGHDGIRKIVDEVAENEQNSNPEIAMAEISHLSRPHSGNVQIRPDSREYKIPYLSYRGNTEDNRSIDINDLVVSVVGGKVKLRSIQLDKDVCPCFSSAYNYKFGTSELYQFLGDVQRQSLTKMLSSQLDSLLSMLGHLPRVSYKNIIVSAETWIVDNTWADLDFTQGMVNFRRQHDKAGMPRFLSLNQGDNYFIVDKMSDVSIKEFFNLTKNMKKVILSEFLLLSEDIEHYETVMEIIQPFIQKDK